MFGPVPETSLENPGPWSLFVADLIPAMKLAHEEVKDAWAGLTRKDAGALTHQVGLNYAMARSYDYDHPVQPAHIG